MRGEKKHSILADHLGTPTHLLSEQGDTIWEGSLDSYGKLRIDKGDIGSCPFRYQGQYEDVVKKANEIKNFDFKCYTIKLKFRVFKYFFLLLNNKEFVKVFLIFVEINE